MAYLLIDNFASGLDRRRSAEMAPTGSLRKLENAFINEGGEIEKRKAFVKDDALTAYGQTASIKGLMTGPHPIPGYSDSVFFRHRYDTLPTSGWTAGAGGLASVYEAGTGLQKKRFWAQKSTLALSNFGALFHGASAMPFGSNTHVLEQHVSTATSDFTQAHVKVTFTDDEPTAEALVAANADRNYLFVLDGKGYLVEGSTLHVSAVNDPADMAGTGSATIDVASKGRSVGQLVGLAEYYGQLVVFGRQGAQIYTVDPDPDLTQYQRRVQTSLIAARSAIEYSDGDLIYLSRAGVRSLRARDSSNFAKVDDIGSPIDRMVTAQLAYDVDDVEPIFVPTNSAIPISDFYTVAASAIVQETGQLWLAVGERIYVLSRFPSARVQAWSMYDLPVPDPANVSGVSGIQKSRWIADICPIGNTVAFRNFADEVFLYGGANGSSYDDATVVVETPFADMGRPGDLKNFSGMDIVCDGDWRIEATSLRGQDGEPESWFPIAEVSGSTRQKYRIPLNFQGYHIALRMTTTDRRAARIAQVGVYYQQGSEK